MGTGWYVFKKAINQENNKSSPPAPELVFCYSCHYMHHELQSYLHQAGLNISSTDVDPVFAQGLHTSLAAMPENSHQVEALFTYPVPKLSPGSSCSIHGEREDKPFDVRTILNPFTSSFTGDYSLTTSLFRMNLIAALLHAAVQSDWTGIYGRYGTTNGPALVKLAYCGRPSRAIFPLTKEFAAHSNNSTVGLTGKAILVKSVRAHLEEGKPYYECDAAVQSELCLPIFSNRHPEPSRRTVEASLSDLSNVIGIIDLESFRENHFTDERILKAAFVCAKLSDVLSQLIPQSYN